MRIEFDGGKLLSFLKWAKSKTSSPHTAVGMVLFESVGGQIVVSATDLDLWYEQSLGPFEGEFEPFALPREPLLVGLAPSAMTMESDGNRVHIATDGGEFSRLTIPMLDASEFPKAEAGSGTTIVLAEEALDILSKWMAVTENEYPGGLVDNVFARVADGQIEFARTDTRILAVAQFDGGDARVAGSDGLEETSVPVSVLVAAAKAGVGAVYLTVGDKVVTAAGGGRSVSGRRLEMPRPHYEDIPLPDGLAVSCGRLELLRAVQRCAAIDPCVEFSLFRWKSDASLCVKAESPEANLIVHVETENREQFVPFSLSASYVIRSLKAMDVDEVEFVLPSKQTIMIEEKTREPILIRPKGDESKWFLLAPMAR